MQEKIRREQRVYLNAVIIHNMYDSLCFIICFIHATDTFFDRF